jgi:heme exporter protein C
MEKGLKWTKKEFMWLGLGMGWILMVMVGYLLFTSEGDYVQGESYKMIYWHVPAAWWTLWCYGGSSIGAFIYLWKKNPGWDKLSEAWANVALIWSILTVWTGALWGKITWGVYWVWDARLTSMAVLVIILLGLPILRSRGSPIEKAKRSAFWILLGAWNVPLIKASVDWWNTLHQSSTLTLTGSSASPSILFLLLISTLSAGFFTFVLFSLFLRHSFLSDRLLALSFLKK